MEQNDLIPTRDTLLIRLKDWNDDESWKEFFDIYWRLIYRTAMKAGLSDAEARDVVQETVIGVFRNIPDFQYNPEIGSFKRWLKNQTTWRINDHLRKRRSRYDRSEADLKSMAAPIENIADPAGFDPASHWDNEWEKNLLVVAMERVKARVDAKMFQVFELYVVDGLPAQKVSALMGVRRTSVYLSKHRVTALLKQETRKLRKRTSESLAAARAKARI